MALVYTLIPLLPSLHPPFPLPLFIEKIPKKSILTDRHGGPLSIVVAGANVVDAKLLDRTIEALVVDRPEPTEEKPQHLCLDKGYDNPSGKAAVEKHHYTGHIRRIGEEKLSQGKKSIRLAAGSWKGH